MRRRVLVVPFVPGPDNSVPVDPSWFAAMTDKTWTAVAGGSGYGSTYQNGARLDSVLSDAATNGGPTRFWNGAWVSGTLFGMGPNGGHGDRDLNDVMAIDLNAAQPAWVQLRAASTPTGGDATSNGAADFADNRPRPCHTQNRLIGVPGGFWLSGMDNMTSGMGENSSAYYYFDFGTGDWTQYAPAYNSTQWANLGGNFHGGASCYDPTTGYIWVLGQETSLTTNNAIYVIDTGQVSGVGNRGTIVRRFLSYMPFGYQLGAILHDRNPKILLILSSYGTVYYADINSLPADGATITWTNITSQFSGSYLGPSGGADHGGMVYHEASGALLLWDASGTRTQINKIAIPSDHTGGTYTSTFVSADASNTVTPTAETTDGVNNFGTFSRFNLVTMPSGRQCLVIINEKDQPVFVYKLPAAGL